MQEKKGSLNYSVSIKQLHFFLRAASWAFGPAQAAGAATTEYESPNEEGADR